MYGGFQWVSEWMSEWMNESVSQHICDQVKERMIKYNVSAKCHLYLPFHLVCILSGADKLFRDVHNAYLWCVHPMSWGY